MVRLWCGCGSLQRRPWMQRLAGSFKQSETAFLHRDERERWRLRWFTPTCEVELCGHATLAATLALAHWGELALVTACSSPAAAAHCTWACILIGRMQAIWCCPAAVWSRLPVPKALQDLLGQRIERYWGSPLGYRVALLHASAPLARPG